MSNSARCDQDQGYKNGISTGPSQGREAAGAGQHLGGGGYQRPLRESSPQHVTVLTFHLDFYAETLDATDKPFYFPS